MNDNTDRIAQVIDDLRFFDANLNTLYPSVADRLRDFIPAVLSCEIGHAVTQQQWDSLCEATDEWDKSVGLTDSHYWQERIAAAKAAILRATGQVAA